MKKSNRARNSGFALIVVAILLILAGIVVAGSLPVRSDQMLMRENGTKEKLDAIRQAMAFYYTQNNSLYPCPAARLARGSANYGTSQALCAGITPVSSTLLIGAVPVRTLNLPDSYMYDEWGNQFTYAIDIGQTTGTVTPGSNVLVVKDISGVVVSPVGSTSSCSKLKYIVTSHGPDGYGAYGNSSTQSACTASVGSHDLENCDNDVEFRYDKWQYASGLKSYDDVSLVPTADDEGGTTGSSDGPPISANMVVWLNGADNTNIFNSVSPDVPATDGQTVAKWNSGCGVTNVAEQTTGSKQPIYTASGLKGKGVVTFDSTDDVLTMSSTTSMNTQLYSIYTVFLSTATDSNRRYAWSFNSNWNEQLSVYAYPGSNANNNSNGVISTPKGSYVLNTLIGGVTSSRSYGYGVDFTTAVVASPTVTYLKNVGNFHIPTATTSLGGSIAELIVYSGSHTDSQRKSIEQYLGNKWGIYTPPITSPFVTADNCPGGVTGCKAWFDASDTTSLRKDDGSQVTANNDPVATWLDKSGNQQNFYGLYNSSTRRPLYKTNSLNGLSAINFDGSNDVFQGLVSLGANPWTANASTPTQATYFIVQKLLTTASSGYDVYGANAGARYCIGTGCSGASRLGVSNISSSIAYRTSSPFISTIVQGSPSKFSLNGTNATTSTYNNLTTIKYLYNLGAVASATFSSTYNADMMEFIVYPRALSEADQKSVECALASKWNLYVPKCVITSPYTTTGLCPGGSSATSGLTACRAWFDASDPDTIYKDDGTKVAATAGGATFSTWLDKSGNGNDAHTYYRGFSMEPKYRSSVQNSMSGVNFDNVNDSLSAITRFSGANFTSVAVFSRGGGYGYLFNFGYQPSVTGSGNYIRSEVATSNTPANLFTSGTYGISTYIGSSPSSHFLNGNAAGSTIYNYAANNVLQTLGSNYGFGEPLNGNILEIIFYDSAVDTATRKRAECYLANKWGLCAKITNAATYCSGISAHVSYCSPQL